MSNNIREVLYGEVLHQTKNLAEPNKNLSEPNETAASQRALVLEAHSKILL